MSEQATQGRRGDEGGSRIDPRAAVLWASAFVLGGLILLQGAGMAGSSGGSATAQVMSGGMKSGEMTALSVDVGVTEAVFVVDDRSEQLLVYRVTPKDGLNLRFRQDLPSLFGAARLRAGD